MACVDDMYATQGMIVSQALRTDASLASPTFPRVTSEATAVIVEPVADAGSAAARVSRGPA